MTNLINIEDLANILGQKGVSNNAKIIIYGESIDPSAGRVFWVLEYLGATDVHMLDGGYDKWKKDGYATVIDKTVKDATTFAASVGSPMLATKSYVLANYNNSGFSLVDGRNHLDYKVKRIPNAVNLLVGDYLNSDNTVKSYSQLRELFDSKGITSNKTIITYCYVGYRSAQAYFIYRLMGYKVSNYDGSWTEWNADSSLPTEP
jgi:thiosulfate/3-mercaptopyruvate sulfurtransferase